MMYLVAEQLGIPDDILKAPSGFCVMRDLVGRSHVTCVMLGNPLVHQIFENAISFEMWFNELSEVDQASVIQSEAICRCGLQSGKHYPFKRLQRSQKEVLLWTQNLLEKVGLIFTGFDKITETLTKLKNFLENGQPEVNPEDSLFPLTQNILQQLTSLFVSTEKTSNLLTPDLQALTQHIEQQGRVAPC